MKFPIELRIPGWADSVSVKYRNKSLVATGGSHFRLDERWKNGDRITVEIPMELRTEKRYNNSLSLIRGPIYFSLRINKAYKSIKTRYDNYGYKGSVDWEIDPMSPWNYGLLIDRHNVSRGITVSENTTRQVSLC